MRDINDKAMCLVKESQEEGGNGKALTHSMTIQHCSNILFKCLFDSSFFANNLQLFEVPKFGFKAVRITILGM